MSHAGRDLHNEEENIQVLSQYARGDGQGQLVQTVKEERWQVGRRPQSTGGRARVGNQSRGEHALLGEALQVQKLKEQTLFGRIRQKEQVETMTEFSRPRTTNPHNFSAAVANPRKGGKVNEQARVDIGHVQAPDQGREREKPVVC